MKAMKMMAAGLVMVLGMATAGFCADATLNLDVNSAYVSRGVTYNDGLVLQPSLDIIKGGFDINIWGNMDIGDYNETLDSGEFSELDLAMYYSHSIDKLTLTGGIIGYVYPPTDKKGSGLESTQELYAGASLAMAEGLALSLSVYYDYDQYKDTCYSNLGIAYSIPVNKQLGITAGVSAGYLSERDSAAGESGFNDYKLSLKASYALTDTIGLAANINYTDAIDDDVLLPVSATNIIGEDVNTYGGVSVNCKF